MMGLFLLHHIHAAEHILLFKGLYRFLNKNGVLVAFEYNPPNPLTVKAVNTCEFDQNAVLIRAGTLQRRLSLAGFKDIKCA